MSAGFVQVMPDSTGKKVQTFENTLGADLVEAQAVVPVDASGNPISFASNTPDVVDRAARLLGHVTIDNASLAVTVGNASIPVTGTFWQATQPVSGTFWQATQPVSIAATVTIAADTAANQPNALKVDGSGATQPISGSVSVSNFPATQTVSGTVTANAGTGTFAISAASLPLPSGAATAAKQPALGTAGTASADVLTVQGIASMTALKVDGSAVTQPVSGTVTANAGTGTFSVSGTVTANIGTTNGLALDATLTGGSQRTKITDGTNNAAVKAASTAAAATDPSLVVALHPSSALPAGSNVIGALTANQSVNVAQVAGAAAVASVTGVQDVMPRKRTGSTGLAPNYSASHIASNVTTTVTSATCYVSCVVLSCSAAGTSWTVKVQNKEATPKVLVPNFTLTVPTNGSPVVLQFAEPILMTSGVDIITAGTTAGTLDAFVTYWA